MRTQIIITTRIHIYYTHTCRSDSHVLATVVHPQTILIIQRENVLLVNPLLWQLQHVQNTEYVFWVVHLDYQLETGRYALVPPY